ncbi:hypothetical protein [uncultured Helicobacter sp.]|uniref:hypothetical protein n=1 Tax=uncultured Helicobacter sp. TaxID=175537 RepID=UPI00261DB221|nr:hypothetical protein [uncultured Helicobacter sp.]
MKLLDKERNLLLEVREMQDMFCLEDSLQNTFHKKKEQQENLISFCEKSLHSLNYKTQEIILVAESSQELFLLNGHKEETYLYNHKSGLQLKQPNLF